MNLSLSFLHHFSPELAHNITLQLLKFKPKFLYKSFTDDLKLNQHLWGLDFNNPIGLAAGFDKNAQVLLQLLDFGFGFVEAGTVTPKPQLGNDKPRVFRLPMDEAIINHLGFKKYGIESVKKKIRKN